MRIKIKVTKEVLQKSAMCGLNKFEFISENCAIAVAVRDIFPEARVLSKSIFPFGTQCNCSFPHGMDRFIDRFDRMAPSTRLGLIPFQFEVNVPDSVIDRIGLSEVHRILKESKTLELCQ